MSNKAVVLLSGGMDSAVLLAHMLYEGYECEALAVDYGQRHTRELQAASMVADHYMVGFRVVDMSLVGQQLFAGAKSSQVGERVDVPHGHYTAENMKLTIVPNRNMLLLALAGARAVATEADTVAYAAHAGDHAVYPDCRPGFANAMSEALWEANSPGIQLVRPFIHKTKTDICDRGSQLDVPFQLTWSCYDPQEVRIDVEQGYVIHCGKCGTCVERKEAFRDAGVEDPTAYADYTESSGAEGQ